MGKTGEIVLVQYGDCRIEAKIDGKYLSKGEMDRFVIGRVRKAERKLSLPPMDEADADAMLARLTDEKMEMGSDAVKEKLSGQVRICNAATGAVIRLSGGKRKSSVTEVEVKGLDLDVFLSVFDRLQAENSEENLRANLGVEPDHYYLGATVDGSLEVIEACGSNSLPTQMFITYGDETGLRSEWESDEYEEERAGRKYMGRPFGKYPYALRLFHRILLYRHLLGEPSPHDIRGRKDQQPHTLGQSSLAFLCFPDSVRNVMDLKSRI